MELSEDPDKRLHSSSRGLIAVPRIIIKTAPYLKLFYCTIDITYQSCKFSFACMESLCVCVCMFQMCSEIRSMKLQDYEPTSMSCNLANDERSEKG